MNDVDKKTTLAGVIGRVFEDAAFVFTDVLDESDKPAAGEWDAEGVELTFSGHCTGTLRMWAGRGFACYAAANMLGIDEEAEGAREKGMDALKELLNIVVGNYLPEVYGDKPVFELGLPRKLPPERLEQDMNDPAGVWLEAEGNAVVFTVDEG